MNNQANFQIKLYSDRTSSTGAPIGYMRINSHRAFQAAITIGAAIRDNHVQESLVGRFDDSQWNAGELIGLYTDCMPGYLKPDVPLCFYDPAGSLNIELVWNLSEDIDYSRGYADTQYFILLNPDKPLPDDLKITMNYDNVPFDPESHDRAVKIIPPYVTPPEPLRVVTLHPALRQLLAKPAR